MPRTQIKQQPHVVCAARNGGIGTLGTICRSRVRHREGISAMYARSRYALTAKSRNTLARQAVCTGGALYASQEWRNANDVGSLSQNAAITSCGAEPPRSATQCATTSYASRVGRNMEGANGTVLSHVKGNWPSGQDAR